MYGYRAGVGRTLSFSGRALAPAAAAPAASPTVVYVQAPTQYNAPAQQITAAYARELTTSTPRGGGEASATAYQQAPEQPSGPEPLPLPESHYLNSETTTQTDLTSGKGYAIGIGALVLLALLLLAGKRRKRKRR